MIKNKKNILLVVVALIIGIFLILSMIRNSFNIDKFLGEFNDEHLYKNEYFDFEVKIPEKWVINEDVSIRFLNSTIENLDENEIKGALLFAVAEKYIKDPEYSNGISIDCSATRVESSFENEVYEQMNDLIIVDEINKFTKENEINKIEDDGKIFYVSNMIKDDSYKTYYFTESNGFIIKFIFNYKSIHKNSIESIISSIKF